MVELTPTQAVACQRSDCDKVYKTRGTMLAHMRKHHKDSTVIQSPLGSFPPSNSAMVLHFGETENAATQGNSKGAVNSPKIINGSTYMCAICDIHFPRKEEVTSHMEEIHISLAAPNAQDLDNDEDLSALEQETEVMLAAVREEQELHEELVRLSQEIKEPELVEKLQEKLERYKVLTAKKSEIQKETNEEMKNLKVDQKNRQEIEEYMTKEIEKKGKEIEALKKVVTTDKRKHQHDVDELIKKNGELVKENSSLKTSIQEKESIVVHLEEQINTEEVVVVEPGPNNVFMNKTANGHTCTACEKSFGSNRALEKHIADKHQESECPFCSQVFQSRQGLRKHVNECVENGTNRSTCEKCNKTFSNFGLRRHEAQCKGTRNNKFICNECELICKNSWELKKHTKEEHTESHEVSREVCKHYKKGFCFNGDQCRFSHVGFQQRETISRPSTADWTPACRHGDSCSWLTRGKCSFFHKGIGVQNPGRQSQKTPHQSTARNQCRFGSRCDRKETCPNSHGRETVFHQNPKRNQQVRTSGRTH